MGAQGEVCEWASIPNLKPSGRKIWGLLVLLPPSFTKEKLISSLGPH